MDKRKLHCKIFSKGSTLSNSNKLRYFRKIFQKKFRNKKQAEDFIDTLKIKKKKLIIVRILFYLNWAEKYMRIFIKITL